MRYLLAVLLSLCFLPSVALGAPAQVVATYKEIARTPAPGGYAQAQLIMCDNDGSPGPDGNTNRGSLWETGETCESGDWSEGFWAGGYDEVRIHFEEYGANTALAYVWNCHLQDVPGGTPRTNRWNPATQAPVTAASATVNVECYELTTAVGASLDGTATKSVTVGGSDAVVLGMLYGEIQTCTVDCSSRLSVSVR